MTLPKDQTGRTIQVFPINSTTNQGVFVNESTVSKCLLKANEDCTVTIVDKRGSSTVNLSAGEVVGIADTLSVTTDAECKMS